MEIGLIEDDYCVGKCVIKMGMGCPIAYHNDGIVTGSHIGGSVSVKRDELKRKNGDGLLNDFYGYQSVQAK